MCLLLQCVLTSLSATRPLSVNGEVIRKDAAPRVLKHQDVLKIHDRMFRFQVKAVSDGHRRVLGTRGGHTASARVPS